MLFNNSLVCLLIYWVVGRVALHGYGGDEFNTRQFRWSDVGSFFSERTHCLMLV